MTRRRPTIDYDPVELVKDFDDAYQQAWTIAQATARDPSYYVVLDGASRPFYGKGYRFLGKGKKEARPGMTVAGLNSTGAFRGQKNGSRGVPMYAGTDSKHDRFIMSAHLHDSKATLPLGVRRGLVSEDSIRDFIGILAKQPRKPDLLTADKEFGNYKKTKDLLAACAEWRTVLLIAAPRNKAIAKMILAAWHNGQAARLEGTRKTVFWVAQEHAWVGRRKVRNTLLTFYFYEDPRKDKTLTDENLMRLPNGLWTVCFLTNVKVDASNARWLLEAYADRWAVENLNKRVISYCGASFSHGLFMRDFLHHAGLLLFSAYGLWRLQRTQAGDLDLHDRKASHSRYFGAVHRLAELALLGLKPTRQ